MFEVLLYNHIIERYRVFCHYDCEINSYNLEAISVGAVGVLEINVHATCIFCLLLIDDIGSNYV